jgi:hypothetical protein
MQSWEYHVTLLYADAEKQRAYLYQRWPNYRPDKNAPEALIPALNDMGAGGWEVISIQPVLAGKNSDILIHSGTDPNHWSAWYLCAFKRPVATAC